MPTGDLDPAVDLRPGRLDRLLAALTENGERMEGPSARRARQALPSPSWRDEASGHRPRARRRLPNAVVDGAIKGHYAELDAAGRYHLRMMDDRSERTNLGATPSNEVTTRKTLMADESASLLGRSVVFVAGAGALSAAVERGIEQLGAVSKEALLQDLARLSMPPSARAQADTTPGAADGVAQPGAGNAGSLWSSLAAGVTEAARSAVNELVRAVASTTDTGLDEAIVEAGGDVIVKGATVTVESGSIKLSGPVLVDGNLTVTGKISGG